MREITLEELLEAGCHFGHQVIRSNPKARDFVYEARDNIQIIDLAKTKEGLEEAASYIKRLGENRGTLLVVGTKRQARPVIEEEIQRVKELLEKDNKDHVNNIYYITERWVGGILTNFSEVSKNLKKLKDLKEKLASEEEKAKFTKKEVGLWEKEKQRLEGLYKGIAEMKKNPDALFIVDSHQENLAVREAMNMGVKTVAIVDTNSDPYLIDHPIPANDDAVGSIKLIVSYIMDAWVEGVKNQKTEKNSGPEEKPKQELKIKKQKKGTEKKESKAKGKK